MSCVKELKIIISCVCLNVLLMGCQSTSKQFSLVPAPDLYSQGFEASRLIKIESEQDIFRLNAEAKHFIRKTMGLMRRPEEKMEALIYGVFDRSKMNLLYRGDANTLASETFNNRAANCLSLSIMMYALATEAGFDVKFQEIMVPEYWTRRQGFTLLNGHINLKVSTKNTNTAFTFYRPAYQVDFDPQVARKSLPKKIVSKQDVVAMFYNNKGADAILKGDYDTAYAYFSSALTLMPKFQSAWINLGILYRQKGLFEQAEQAYKFALSNNDKSLTAWENLAHLYRLTDRAEEADVILAKVQRARSRNPYYHLNLGEEQLERKNWDEALDHFKHALALDRSKHEVYFGLAKVYFELGELKRSERFLKQAKLNADSRQIAGKYQNKLNFLHDL